ncbi:hypothetical protein ACTXT7_016981, partial [Hymenolepis weldensis]
MYLDSIVHPPKISCGFLPLNISADFGEKMKESEMPLDVKPEKLLSLPAPGSLSEESGLISTGTFPDDLEIWESEDLSNLTIPIVDENEPDDDVP